MSSSPAEPGARDPRELSAEDAVDVDLIPPRVVLPKVRRAVAVGHFKGGELYPSRVFNLAPVAQ